VWREDEEEKKVDAGKEMFFEDLGKDGEFQGAAPIFLFKITKMLGKRGEKRRWVRSARCPGNNCSVLLGLCGMLP
jgi:hypothetical protein